VYAKHHRSLQQDTTVPAKTAAVNKKKAAIVGNPNVGKSTLFNEITRAYSLVANFPYTTISVARADVVIGGEPYEIIDTPGLLSLDVQSEDGMVTRDILLQERQELIILCLDASNLTRSLVLTSQIFDCAVPVIICLNMIDESQQKGITIQRDRLEQLLGVPVVETVASEGHGIKQLLKKIPQAAAAREGVRYTADIGRGVREVLRCFPRETLVPEAVALLLLEQDPAIERHVREAWGSAVADKACAAAERARLRMRRPLARMLLENRTRWAERISREVSRTRDHVRGRTGEVIGSLSRHPVWGWFIMCGIIYGTYFLVGTVGAGMIVPLLDNYFFIPLNSAIGSMIPWEPAHQFMVGPYGILTTGLANAVGTVLPILTLFFLVLNVLEDVGYIANLCVLSNRVFKRIGLSGKAVLPIILGFGCKTMATLTTKILDSRKERYIAIFLIAFAIPCSPLIGINLAVLSFYPFSAFLAVLAIIIVLEAVSGLALNRIIKQDRTTDFILEIPPVRLPILRNIATKTCFRLKWFLQEAVPLFMAGSCILFTLDRFRLLELLKRLIFPVIVTFLNLPVQFVDAFLLSLTRKEAGAVILLNLAQNHQIDRVQAIVGTVVLTCLFPCFANIMTMIRELGLRSALFMLLVISAFSVIIGGAINYLLRLGQ
jgi:ferrous iron transport protein B